jgi:hypothetical protein
MVTTAVFYEGRHAGEFILSEANFHRSRDNIVVASGSGVIAAGTVLGRVTATGKYTVAKKAASDGSAGFAAVCYANIDATAADVPVTGLTRDFEAAGQRLVYDASFTLAQDFATLATQAAALGIIIR